MSTVTKRHVITSVDGTQQLFQVPDEYTAGTLWAFIVLANTSVTLRDTTYFDGGFFQLTPAPPAGSNLYCIYDTEVEDTTSPTPPTSLQIPENILKILTNMNITIKGMDKAIQNRVTIEDFSASMELMSDRIRRLELLAAT